MGDKKKYKVTLNGEGFSYTVVVEAGEKATMLEFKELAIKKIKEQYKVDVPSDIVVDLEFEIAND
ncbi:MAG: hypothetical protein KGH57_02290 [Candidatus Micrarchaeota archaeon]|nr:hypothetical protein [Candidatus Micrarchaeota archaeon]